MRFGYKSTLPRMKEIIDSVKIGKTNRYFQIFTIKLLHCHFLFSFYAFKYPFSPEIMSINKKKKGPSKKMTGPYMFAARIETH
jgi:hypothetical protein